MANEYEASVALKAIPNSDPNSSEFTAIIIHVAIK